MLDHLATGARENGHEPLTDEDIERLVDDALDTDDVIEAFPLADIYIYMHPTYVEEALADTVLNHLNGLANLQFAIRAASKANKSEEVARFSQEQLRSQYMVGAVTKKYPGTLPLARELSEAKAASAKRERAALLEDEAKRLAKKRAEARGA